MINNIILNNYDKPKGRLTLNLLNNKKNKNKNKN